MLTRFGPIALGTALGLASLTTYAGAQTPKPIPTMIPILEVERVTSADHVFIDKALRRAVDGMESANGEIGNAGTVDVQNEAVRTFNTSAAAYNDLADIASRRNMNYPKPKASQLNDSPALAQDAKPSLADVRYVGATQTALEATIALYHAEIARGKDKLAVAFAKTMRSRYEHDLDLVTLDIANLDHPKPPPPDTVAPDPLPPEATPAAAPAAVASPSAPVASPSP